MNFPENDEKTRYKGSHRDLASVWEAFKCWLSKRVLNWPFSESGISKFFTVSNFGNAVAMAIIFFFKMFKI